MVNNGTVKKENKYKIENSFLENIFFILKRPDAEYFEPTNTNGHAGM